MSIIPDNNTRFGITMVNLLNGRVSISRGATSVSKVGLAIAIKYAYSRKQFGPPGKPEVPLITYTSHQVLIHFFLLIPSSSFFF